MEILSKLRSSFEMSPCFEKIASAFAPAPLISLGKVLE